jgi:hypothetical protein
MTIRIPIVGFENRFDVLDADGIGVSVASYGAVGDGVTDDTAALDAAFTYAGATGTPLFVPPGTYMLSATIDWAVVKGFRLECAPGAVFKATSTFSTTTKMFLPSATTPDQGFIWIGGKIDGSLRPQKTGGAPDQLYIATPNINRVLIEGVWFYNNEDRSGTAGDSCLFLSAGTDYIVRGCKFQGALDAGIYVSGDSTGTQGERCFVSENTFIECKAVGFISKRHFQRHIVVNNYVTDCGTGLVVGGEVSPHVDLSEQVIFMGNDVRRVTRGIEARVTNGAVIIGNRVIDYGVEEDGTTVGDQAISLSGASNCIVQGNYIEQSGAFATDGGSSGVKLGRRTVDGVDYDADNNLVCNNRIVGAALGIREEAECQGNILGPNFFTTTTAPYSASGTAGIVGLTDTRYEIDAEVVDIAGKQNAASLRVVRVTNGVNYLSARGAATGESSGVSIVAGGTDDNIPLALQGKGTSPILMGGAAGSESVRIRPGNASGNALDLFGAAAGSAPRVVARGADTNVNLELAPKGTGRIVFAGSNGARFPSAASDPTGATNGEVYYNTATNKLRVYANATWVDLH